MKEESKEFLINEFNNTYEEWRRTREAGYSRIQFLLGITTAVIGGVGLITQLKNFQSWDVALFLTIGFGFLCLIAFQTSEYMVSRAIASDLNTRAIARIRRYFLDNDPKIIKHLTWQTDDSATKLFLVNSKGGLIRTTQIMLSIFIAGTLSSLLYLIINKFYPCVCIFIFVLIVAYIILHNSTKKRLGKAWNDAQSQQRFSKAGEAENESETAFKRIIT